MKKKFFILLMLCVNIALAHRSASFHTVYPINKSPEYRPSDTLDTKLSYLPDTTALKNFIRGSNTAACITDKLTGGTFKWATTGTPDHGTVFPANGGGYWIRSYNDEVKVAWFGTDSLAITRALNTGARRIYLSPNVTYVTQRQILIKNDNTTIIGNNSTIMPDSLFPKTDDALIIGVEEQNTFRDTTSYTVTKGSNIFKYPKASLLEVGSIVLLSGPQYSAAPHDYSYGLYASIVKISNDTVTLNTAATDGFSGNLLKQYKALKNITITGVDVDMRNWHYGKAIALNNVINATVNQCFVQSDNKSTSAVIGIFATGINIDILQNKAYNFRYVTENAGYDISVAGINITVQGNDVIGAKHGIQSSSRTFKSENIRIIGNVASGGASARLDMHGNINSGVIKDNVVNVGSCNTGILVRSPNIEITNNIIKADGAFNTIGISAYEFGARNLSIHDNKFFNQPVLGPGSLVNKAILFNNLKDTVSSVNISHNYLQGEIEFSNDSVVLGKSIYINNNLLEDNGKGVARINIYPNHVDGYIIENNTIRSKVKTDFTYGLYITSVDTVNGYIRDNVVYMDSANTNPAFRIATSNNMISGNRVKTNFTPVTNSGVGNLYISNTQTNYSSVTSNWALNNMSFDVSGQAIKLQNIQPTLNAAYNLGAPTFAFDNVFVRTWIGNSSQDIRITTQGTNGILFQSSSTGNTWAKMFGATGNFVLQSGGTFTDDGLNKLQVAGSVKSFHLVGGTFAPAVAAGAAAGVSPSISLSGTDMAGDIEILSGTSPVGNDVIATVTFNKPYSTAPHVIVSRSSSPSSDYYIGTCTASGFKIYGTLAAGTDYKYSYVVVQ